MVEKRKCPECGKDVTVLKDGGLRLHYTKVPDADGALVKGDVCPGGAQPKASSIEAKARQYMAEGRVRAVRIEPGFARVLVQGSKPEPYAVEYRIGQWVCPCEAQTWRCAHVVAAGLIIDEDALGDPVEVIEIGGDAPVQDTILGGPPSVKVNPPAPDEPDDDLFGLLTESVEQTRPEAGESVLLDEESPVATMKPADLPASVDDDLDALFD